MKARHERFLLIGAALLLLVAAVAMVLSALKDNLEFFYTPSQVVAGEAPVEKTFRVGGMVQEGSIKRQGDGLTVEFVITDTAQQVPVFFKGSLPDLFKEGKGAVVKGRLDPGGQFTAIEVLAKHDENYTPPEAAHAVEQAQRMQKTLENP